MDFVIKATDLKRAYRQYLEILQPLIKCTSKEADILAQFMYYNYINRDIPERVRWQVIFSTETRRVIREELNMSTGSFNNNIASLKKSILAKEDLPAKLKVYPELIQGNLIVKLNFYLTINAEGDKKDN